jgi:hypothetical protein
LKFQVRALASSSSDVEAMPKRPQYLVEKSFPQQNGEKVEKLLTEKSEKSLQKTEKNA